MCRSSKLDRALALAVVIALGASAACSGDRDRGSFGPGASGAGASSGSGASGSGGAGAAGGAGGVGSGGEGGERVSFSITLVTDAGPWDVTQDTTGIAADAAGTVWIQDDLTVWELAAGDGAITEYLTAAEASAIVGHNVTFQDLDRGSDGDLYIIADDALLRSNVAHGATATALPDIGRHISVSAPDDIGFVGFDAFYRLHEGTSAVAYDVGFDNVNCATEDLAVTASGSLLYQPGCNADPIVVGSIDGQPLNAIFDPNGGGAALGIDNFQCLARDPSGGFYVVVRTGSEVAPQVLDHFDENVTEQGGYTEVLTMPALSQADAANPSSISSVAMSYCSLAVAPSNQIYLLSFERLWRLDPIGG